MMHWIVAAVLFIGPVDASSPQVPDEAMPRVSVDQQRPSQVGTQDEQHPEPIGEGTGAAPCLSGYRCTGGAICATGTCEELETASGCVTCTADKLKCKAKRCT
jgi:hypothetical protein